MENENEKTLDELRKMTTQELQDHFHIEPWLATELITALDPKRFDILCDNNLTAKEMAKKLGVSRTTAEGYRSGLLKVGLAEKKHEIIPISNQLELLLNKLTKPMSYKDLQKETGFSANQMSTYMRKLRLEKKADMFRIADSPDLFGELACKSYAFKTEQKDAAIELIIMHLPPLEEIRAKTLGASLTSCLNQSKLPREIFSEVYAYYTHSYSLPKAARTGECDIAKSMFRKFEKIVNDFGIESKTPEELANTIGILSEHGFFKDDAYEINKVSFIDPGTGELEEGLEMSLIGGPKGDYTHIMSLLYSDAKSRVMNKYVRIRYDLLKAIQSAEKPPTNADIRKKLEYKFKKESIYQGIITVRGVGLVVESEEGTYTLSQSGLEYIADHESRKGKKEIPKTAQANDKCRVSSVF